MSSEPQSTLELLRLNDYTSRMVIYTSNQWLILLTSTVMIVTAVVYDYSEQCICDTIHLKLK